MDDPKQILRESSPHSYIVKVWPEQIDENGQWIVWRGHITHVPSGVQQYFENLNDVTEFIKPYLRSMGIKVDIYARIGYWMKHWLLNRNG